MEPTTCKSCGAPDCDDWMYRQGLIPADQAICGKCKLEFGRKFYAAMAREYGIVPSEEEKTE